MLLGHYFSNTYAKRIAPVHLRGVTSEVPADANLPVFTAH